MPPIKLFHPIINEAGKPAITTNFVEEEYLELYSFEKITFNHISKEYQTINKTIFTNCTFIECGFKGTHFNDVVFNNCDLSNSDFSSCIFYRVEFIDCKLLGTNFPEAALNHTFLKGCNCHYLNLSFSKLRSVIFMQCELLNSSFNSCKFSPADFDHCDLTETEFSHTSLKGMDFSNSRIAGMKANLSDLKGMKVTSLQALELVRILDITITD